MVKNYVLDTSVLLHSSNSIRSFGDNVVVIPYVVLEELDKFKTRDDEVGKNARQVTRDLNLLREQGLLSQGVTVNESGGTLKVELGYIESQDPSLVVKTNDDQILNVCLGLAKNGNTVLVSKDINLVIRADVFGLPAEDFSSDKLVADTSELYTGTASLEVSSEVIDSFYAGESIYYDTLTEERLFPNQYLTLTSSTDPAKTALARVQHIGKPLARVKKSKLTNISPRNREQQFLVDAMMDKNISIVSITGAAGTGKTLLSLACCLDLIESGEYEKLIISRPIQPMGKDIGYLPGTELEKLSPWMGPIKDSINFLTKAKAKSRGHDMFTEMIEFGMLEVAALTFIKGRSLPNTLYLIDEAEDLSRPEIKTIVSRMGDNSKVILIGDVLQISNPYVDTTNNGLSIVAEKFKEYEFAAHLTLTKGERSELATVASKIL
jgi:PhoH-like ATPase